MIGTLVGILLGALVAYFPLNVDPLTSIFISILLLAMALAFFFFPPFLFGMAYGPLQQSEHRLTPRILEVLKHDKHLAYIKLWIMLFAFASIALTFYPHLFIQYPYTLSVWILALGVSIDVGNALIKRILSYFNPVEMIRIFSDEAIHCIQEEKEVDLCHWIDALSEIAVKSLQSYSPAMCNYVLAELQQITKVFLEASKSIAHTNTDKQTEELGIQDKTSYVLFYLFQRLEMINRAAIAMEFEPTCNYLITTLGKVTVDAANYDITLAIYPLHYLGKFTKQGMAEHLPNMGDTASCTILGIATEILKGNIAYLEIKDPFLSMVNTLSDIARTTFSQDKNSSIPILIQPLRDLKALFTKEDKVVNHPDTPAILEQIDRTLSEFETLETVMRTMPPIPSVEQPQG